MGNIHRFNNQEWFAKKVEQLTILELKNKNAKYTQEHSGDSPEMLLAYLVDCTKELGHSPDQCEVLGGDYIAYRFGNWETAMNQAMLPMTKSISDQTKTKLYKDEYKIQSKLFMHEIQRRRRERREEQEKRRENAMIQKQARLQIENAWEEEHKFDTDEQLLAYVCYCAKELGETPSRKKVLGYKYISERFGGWYATLNLAGLPIPEGMKKPSKKKRKFHQNV